MAAPLLAWVVAGLVIGFICSKGTRVSNVGAMTVIGMFGAIVGGAIIGVPETGVDWYSVIGAIAGALAASALYNALTKPRKII